MVSSSSLSITLFLPNTTWPKQKRTIITTNRATKGALPPCSNAQSRYTKHKPTAKNTRTAMATMEKPVHH